MKKLIILLLTICFIPNGESESFLDRAKAKAKSGISAVGKKAKSATQYLSKKATEFKNKFGPKLENAYRNLSAEARALLRQPSEQEKWLKKQGISNRQLEDGRNFLNNFR